MNVVGVCHVPLTHITNFPPELGPPHCTTFGRSKSSPLPFLQDGGGYVCDCNLGAPFLTSPSPLVAVAVAVAMALSLSVVAAEAVLEASAVVLSVQLKTGMTTDSYLDLDVKCQQRIEWGGGGGGGARSVFYIFYISFII